MQKAKSHTTKSGGRSPRMKTKNIYSYPISKKSIKDIFFVKKRSRKPHPTHRKYKSKETGAIYDETRAIDFMCDEGTPVKAVLDGEVVRIIDGLTKRYGVFYPPQSKKIMSENEQDGNFIVIKHKNDEFSSYSHLQKGKILVKVGQKVKTGDIIAHSGNTGWSIKPHLHFMVFKFTKPMPARDFKSLEVRWKKP